MAYSAFQYESIQAILAHFTEQDNALCADEAGMGKTFIAKGVIEQMADAHLRKEIEAKLKEGKDKKQQSPLPVVEDKKKKDGDWEGFSGSGNKGTLKKQRLTAFVRAVLEDDDWCLETKQGGFISYANTALKGFYNQMKANDELVKSFWFRYYKNLPHLLVGFDAKKQRYTDWDFEAVNSLEIKPFRALYICSNLAIAEQNTRKLCPVPQCSNRGTEEKADRLSTIWYFLAEHPTPYLEMYPITATVATTETPGTELERKCLVKKFGKGKELGDLRQEGEAESLEKLAVDLVVYDEFQNFGDLVALRNMDVDGFDKYLKQVQANPAPPKNEDAQADEDATPEERTGEEDTENPARLKRRVDSLNRVRRIIKSLYPDPDKREVLNGGASKKMPKSLYLSATPFHAPEGSTDTLKFLGMGDLLTLLGGKNNDYACAQQAGLQALESYLYSLGMFRNERYRLLDEQTHCYHRITTSAKGLWGSAAQMDKGPTTKRLLKTTPMINTESENKQKVTYLADSGDEMTQAGFLGADHPRYQALRDIALNPTAEPISLDYPADAALIPLRKPSAQPLATLLWIPPTKHTEPLGGAFARYAEYSKTLAFSSLKATPLAVCELLNQEVMWKGKMLDKDSEEVEKFLSAEMRRAFDIPEKDAEGRVVKLPPDFEAVRDSFIDLLNYSGTTTAQERIQYCKDGCFADMLKEFCDVYPDDTLHELKLALDFSKNAKWCFAQSVDETMLGKGDSGATLRRSFNAPFRPFVAMTTSIGSEGLDFHLYCNRLVHYTAPSSVVSIEQKNGRIDRRNSLAVRRYWVQELQRLATVWEDFTQKGQTSGGLSPHWDSGKENLHYYFLQQQWSNEIDMLDDLLEKRKNYRKVLGMTGEEAALEAVNLSPFAREK